MQHEEYNSMTGVVYSIQGYSTQHYMLFWSDYRDESAYGFV